MDKDVIKWNQIKTSAPVQSAPKSSCAEIVQLADVFDGLDVDNETLNNCLLPGSLNFFSPRYSSQPSIIMI